MLVVLGLWNRKAQRKYFLRSEATRNLRYIEYFGDSASFLKVNESTSYGEDLVTKSKCIGHIQKRFGTRLRKLCIQGKRKKLSHNKPLTGKNTLTNKIIDTLQNYYGMAISQNTHSLAEMINAVYASLHHIASTDENQNHSIGKDSWCKWQKDPDNYEYQHALTEPAVELLEPIYEDPCNPNLLTKCLHGKIQNPNECLNKAIWSRCPKEVWVSLKPVEQAAFAAVAHFNNGNIFF